jgi:SAM-dependent methyltransferase
MKCPELPQFDERGNNIADPRDKSGRKMAYITQVHRLALARYVGRGSGMALDLGCGYGRITRALESLGWTTVGLEPSGRILSHAVAAHRQGIWCIGGLPELPFRAHSFDLILAQNLLRPLHLSGMLDIVRTGELSATLRAGGRLVVVDNIWPGNHKFVTDDWIMDRFARDGLRLTLKVPIRSARWWGIFAVALGLVPRRWTERLAARELQRTARLQRLPAWRYHNVLYIFEKS